MAQQDQTLHCVACGKAFIFTAGEAAFYADRQLSSPPRRCKPCRQRARAQREADQAIASGPDGPHERYSRAFAPAADKWTLTRSV